MDVTNTRVYSPSVALINLSQAQVTFLQRHLGLERCEMYVLRTTTRPEEDGLIPVAIYPPEAAFVSRRGSFSLPQGGNTSRRSLISSLESEPADVLHPLVLPEWGPDEDWARVALTFDQPLVLPLLYQEEMRGVLLVERSRRDWRPEELQELETVTQTLAIAIHLDQGQQWYQQQLHYQQQRQRWERDRWDDLLHQLRNPLTALKTFGKLLLKRLQQEPQALKVAASMVREGEHLQELLQSFEQQIDLTEEETALVWETEAQRQSAPLLLPSPVLVLQPLNLLQVLEPVLQAETAIAREKPISLQVETRSALPLVLGNSQALREVFHNLINNAVKYTPSQGQVWVIFGLGDSEHPQEVGMEIADTGYGIPPADQARIFERHYRGVQSQGEIPGTGLGLAIVRELVEQLQGRLTVMSPNGRSSDENYPGTTFQLWLRIAESS